MGDFTQAQQSAVEVYADGDYSYFETTDEVEAAEKSGNLGDSLFLFIIRELNDAGGDSIEAAAMLRRAADQLEEVASAIDADFDED